MMKTFKIAIIATFTALSIATNYMLIGVPNIKPMDFIVFIGGFCFGPLVGITIGVLSWLVYGVINPQGFVPLIWLATMFSEPIYGIVGGLLAKSLSSTSFNGQRLRLSVFFATMGFLPTVVYDLITNVSFAYANPYGTPIIVTIISGTLFAVTHEVANAAIFGVCSVPMILALRKIAER